MDLIKTLTILGVVVLTSCQRVDEPNSNDVNGLRRSFGNRPGYQGYQPGYQPGYQGYQPGYQGYQPGYPNNQGGYGFQQGWPGNQNGYNYVPAGGYQGTGFGGQYGGFQGGFGGQGQYPGYQGFRPNYRPGVTGGYDYRPANAAYNYQGFNRPGYPNYRPGYQAGNYYDNYNDQRLIGRKVAEEKKSV